MVPLGMDEETVKHRHKRQKYWKRFPAWVKGYKAGKKGASSVDNPYTLTPEIWSLLRKRARWELGRQESAFSSVSRDKRLKALKKKAKKHKKEKKHQKEKKHHEHKSRGTKKHKRRSHSSKGR